MLRARDGLDLTTQDGMTQYALRCCEILKKVKDPIVMENHLRALVNQTGYDREILMRQIGVVQKDAKPREYRPRNGEKERPGAAVLAERALLTLLGMNAIPSAMVKVEDFSREIHKQAAQWMLDGKNAAAFVETIEDDALRSEAMQALNYAPLPEEHEERMQLAQAGIQTIRRDRMRRRMAEIEEEIKTADSSRKMELYKQMQALTQALED